MADEIDIANDRAAKSLELSIAAARSNQYKLLPHGNCYNCEDPVPHDGVSCFCNADCRNDWQKRQRIL